eukprot:44282-Pleurochrysis_carterae.AAC.2
MCACCAVSVRTRAAYACATRRGKGAARAHECRVRLRGARSHACCARMRDASVRKDGGRARMMRAAALHACACALRAHARCAGATGRRARTHAACACAAACVLRAHARMRWCEGCAGVHECCMPLCCTHTHACRAHTHRDARGETGWCARTLVACACKEARICVLRAYARRAEVKGPRVHARMCARARR